MSNKETSSTERLNAADPALGITEEELTRSREKSLAAMDADASYVAVDGSAAESHRRPGKRRFRLVAGSGLIAAAAAAVLAGVFVASSMPEPLVGRASQAATQPGSEPETGSSHIPSLPEITGRMPTFDNHIVTGGNGNKAAVANDPEADFHMDAANGGKLGVNNSGCFVNASAEGSSNGLIFPAGTTVTETGIVFPDGASLSIGGDFVFGGGLSFQLAPSDCLSTGVGFLVQSWDSIR